MKDRLLTILMRREIARERISDWIRTTLNPRNGSATDLTLTSNEYVPLV